MIYIKIHDTENGSMVAMCDDDLIEKVLEEGDIVIDIKSYSGFYRGSVVDAKKAQDMINELDKVASANVIGKESVEAALGCGIISKKGIMKVAKVPYAHSYSVE
ncbi:MAG: DUF424 domain-containing protein [Candidatus Micrarchaeia archaeon]